MEDVADSTDWLTTPLSGLAPLEASLRCQVCKDFFTTPMITSCSHTFCSLCIRRYLSQEGRCPACRESDQELKLRRNWALEEVVAHFTQARDGILKFARQLSDATDAVEQERPKKRRKVDHAPANVNGEVAGRRSTRSHSKRVAASASQASQEPISIQEIANSEDEGSIYGDSTPKQAKSQIQSSNKQTGEQNDGLVECPCCTRRIKENAINAHLDRCMSGLPSSPEPTTLPSNNVSLAFAQRTKSPTMTAARNRLPPINYALFTDASLRKKLKELGITSTGSKELMRKRHTEWMNLWNANCDALRPKSKRELLRDLDNWERTSGKQLERTVAAGGASGVMVKDFDRNGWVKNQKSEFDDLIQRAREKRKAVAPVEQQDADLPSTNGQNGDIQTASTQLNGMKSPGRRMLETEVDADAAAAGSMDGTSAPEIDRVFESPHFSSKLLQTPPQSDELLQNQNTSIDLTISPAPSTILETTGVIESEMLRKTRRFFDD